MLFYSKLTYITSTSPIAIDFPYFTHLTTLNVGNS